MGRWPTRCHLARCAEHSGGWGGVMGTWCDLHQAALSSSWKPCNGQWKERRRHLPVMSLAELEDLQRAAAAAGA